MITLKKVHKLTKELAKRIGFVNTKKSMSKLTNTLLLGSKYNPIFLSFFVDKPLTPSRKGVRATKEGGTKIRTLKP
jgi:hypothetical protein